MRTFIALPLPSEARAAAKSFMESWRVRCLDSTISWSRPENFHITLRFIGEADEAAIPPISECLRAAAAQCGPLTLAFTGPECFPSEQRAKVLVLATTCSPALLNLVNELDYRLAQWKFGARDKAFLSHVTIGRVRRWNDVMGLPPFGNSFEWSVDRIGLYRSHLTTHGSRYDLIYEVPLD
ncbi:MAG: RNA 2',3'-cyclic phosphodiesterase [Cyanobacteria bacterium NC_groundwater_1444_Ag_S-0.65um_54_12]|nr:RNA 2',3'-cyclic phosphodiesterase [Cyanobacteria bacterium NC_groundwater_1444_Ag_S-0.65um_54_12]